MAHVALMRRTRQRASASEQMGGLFLPIGWASCYENRLRQTCCRGNPCGCPFPEPPNFIPLCGIRKAMAIPAIEHHAAPDTGRESKNPTP